MKPVPVRPAALYAALWLVSTLPVAAADWTPEALMAALAANPGGQVRFVERKFIALLDAPVESAGVLVYRPPERLERHTERPQPESMILDGDTLELERGGRRLTLALSAHPETGAFVDSIRRTLAGDRRALERTWTLALTGDAGLWTLRLEPRSEALRALVQQITITGRRGEVRSIAILQGDGDRSLMTIFPADAPVPTDTPAPAPPDAPVR